MGVFLGSVEVVGRGGLTALPAHPWKRTARGAGPGQDLLWAHPGGVCANTCLVSGLRVLHAT